MKKLKFLIVLFIAMNTMSHAQSSIIGNAKKISTLMVAQFDFPDKMNLNQAENACKTLGVGWRLPTLSESKIIFQNKNTIGNLKDGIYWCGKDEFGDPWRFSAMNGVKMTSLGNENGKYYVRAVRTK